MVSIKGKSLAVGMLLALTTQTYGYNELKYRTEEEKKAQAQQQIQTGALWGFFTGLTMGFFTRLVIETKYKSDLNETKKIAFIAASTAVGGFSVERTMEANDIKHGPGLFTVATAIGAILGSLIASGAKGTTGSASPISGNSE
jgi:cytochrome bd-type quinol oxidase subunit 2